jgi:TatD DNase family protein
MIDTHCHLNFKAFKNNLPEVVKQAVANEVKKIIVPGADLDSSLKAVELTKQYKNIFAAVGIHPIHAKKVVKKFGFRKIKQKLLKLTAYKKVVAIGECGLDYLYFPDDKNLQKKLFSLQIDLAYQLKLPLIFHNRKASEDLLKMVKNSKKQVKKAVFHCFQGDNRLLDWVITNDFFVGINGIVTYDKNMQAVVKQTPLKNIVLETDAPYLLPEPLKSKKLFPNQPKNVKIVADWIAKIKGDSFLNVKNQTTLNAVQLFKV